jgi:hypothetical protein
MLGRAAPQRQAAGDDFLRSPRYKAAPISEERPP